VNESTELQLVSVDSDEEWGVIKAEAVQTNGVVIGPEIRFYPSIESFENGLEVRLIMTCPRGDNLKPFSAPLFADRIPLEVLHTKGIVVDLAQLVNSYIGEKEMALRVALDNALVSFVSLGIGVDVSSREIIFTLSFGEEGEKIETRCEAGHLRDYIDVVEE